MPKGRGNLPDKKEERGLLTRAIVLAPLLTLVLQFLEFLLKILGLIN